MGAKLLAHLSVFYQVCGTVCSDVEFNWKVFASSEGNEDKQLIPNSLSKVAKYAVKLEHLSLMLN